ncbi:MAG: N-acetylneuraminate synthase family protein [Candidatus Thorarchaeota archaeon]
MDSIKRPKVVAEIGTNWNGDYNLLDRMVGECKKCGIDYVKFQALSPELIDRHKELSWYGKASVSPENIQKINQICSKHKMIWFCTPCYPEAVDFLNKYVPFFKIRTADNEREDILQACLSTKKDVYVSTPRPITDQQWLKPQVKQVYCIAKYPTEFGELNFNMITMPYIVGYSNHCLNPLAIFKAIRFGAEYIEFHLTADNTEFALDNKVSFTFGEMKEIMEWINMLE